MQTAMSTRMAGPVRLQKSGLTGLRPRLPVAPLRMVPVAARAASGGPPKTVRPHIGCQRCLCQPAAILFGRAGKSSERLVLSMSLACQQCMEAAQHI